MHHELDYRHREEIRFPLLEMYPLPPNSVGLYGIAFKLDVLQKDDGIDVARSNLHTMEKTVLIGE